MSLSSDNARPPAIRFRWRTRHRTEAIGRHVERNDRRLAAVLRDGACGGRLTFEGTVERCHAFRQIIAEAADMADRKRFGGGVHGEVGMIDAIDLAGGHDRARARCD